MSTDSNTPAGAGRAAVRAAPGAAVYGGAVLASASMRRIEKRLFRIGDDLSRLDAERELVEAELSYHRLIAEDAARDAAVTGRQEDRLEAGLTAADVARFERRLGEIAARRARLEEKRRALLSRLEG